MANLEQEYIKNKKLYRQIFINVQNSIDKKFLELKRNYGCIDCKSKCGLNVVDINLTETLPENCNFIGWQKECLNKLKNEILKDISLKIKETKEQKNQFSCAKCALCCKFAVSEFSPEELKEKAKNGDKFSKEFLSVFIPYENIENAAKIFPEYVNLLKKNNENSYFYYCPKLTEDKLCSDYSNRPSICREFPHDILSIFPKSCGFKTWKDESEVLALNLKALKDISTFYIEKLETTNNPK